MKSLRSALLATALLLGAGGTASAVTLIPTPISLDSRAPMRIDLEDHDDAAVFSVRLEAGKDYALSTVSALSVHVSVIGPDRGPVAERTLGTDYEAGVEIRAPSTGTYVITFSGGQGTVLFAFRDDCRGTTATKCGARLGVIQSNRRFDYPQDRDARRVRLTKGRTYEIQVTDARVVRPKIEVVSARGVLQPGGLVDCIDGTVFGCRLRFRAAYTGDHVIVVRGQWGNAGMYSFLIK